MSPIDPALLALLSKLEPVALGVVALVAKDLASGKSIQATATDLAETAAEDMVALENKALKAAGL